MSFWSKTPPFRQEDRSNLKSNVPDAAFEAIEKDRHLLGYFGDGPEFECVGLTPGGNPGRGVIRTARMASPQVSRPQFHGTLRRDCPLMTRDGLKSSSIAADEEASDDAVDKLIL